MEAINAHFEKEPPGLMLKLLREGNIGHHGLIVLRAMLSNEVSRRVLLQCPSTEFCGAAASFLGAMLPDIYVVTHRFISQFLQFLQEIQDYDRTQFIGVFVSAPALMQMLVEFVLDNVVDLSPEVEAVAIEVAVDAIVGVASTHSELAEPALSLVKRLLRRQAFNNHIHKLTLDVLKKNCYFLSHMACAESESVRKGSFPLLKPLIQIAARDWQAGRSRKAAILRGRGEVYEDYSDGDSEGEGEGEGDSDGEGEGEGEGDSDGEGEGEGDGDGDSDSDSDSDSYGCYGGHLCPVVALLAQVSFYVKSRDPSLMARITAPVIEILGISITAAMTDEPRILPLKLRPDVVSALIAWLQNSSTPELHHTARELLIELAVTMTRQQLQEVLDFLFRRLVCIGTSASGSALEETSVADEGTNVDTVDADGEGADTADPEGEVAEGADTVDPEGEGAEGADTVDPEGEVAEGADTVDAAGEGAEGADTVDPEVSDATVYADMKLLNAIMVELGRLNNRYIYPSSMEATLTACIARVFAMAVAGKHADGFCNAIYCADSLFNTVEASPAHCRGSQEFMDALYLITYPGSKTAAGFPAATNILHRLSCKKERKEGHGALAYRLLDKVPLIPASGECCICLQGEVEEPSCSGGQDASLCGTAEKESTAGKETEEANTTMPTVVVNTDATTASAPPLEMRRLTCGHAFHDGCIRGWIPCRTTCPVCRREALAAIVDELTEASANSTFY